jgi:hypothetical protein
MRPATGGKNQFGGMGRQRNDALRGAAQVDRAARIVTDGETLGERAVRRQRRQQRECYVGETLS